MGTENCMSCDKHKYNCVLGDYCTCTKEHIAAPFPPPCSNYKENTQYEEYDGFTVSEN